MHASSLIAHVRCAFFGADECVPSPLGPRRITYADETATGRASALIETPLAALVLPVVGNAHSTASYTGAAAQCFVDEARGLVRDSVRGAGDASHAVIFGGAGATWASNRLVALLAGRGDPASCTRACASSLGGAIRNAPASPMTRAWLAGR